MMITLKHLTVERFRLLREINLHFPQRGCILIQGPNESGKSALLESIYFALYGESLSYSRNKRSLDDLISYGAASATATLTFSVGATELTIARTIERGQGQQATLRIRRLGLPDEELLSGLGSVNERIVAEMGRVDGETLRNTCLIEQKGLGRLETLKGSEREAAARKLLGLERLVRLSEQFKVGPEDERLLQEWRERLHLADIQVQIPVLSKRLATLEATLDAVTICDDLGEIAQQEADIEEQAQSLEQIKRRRQELKSRQNRLQHLKKAETTLNDIIAAYDTMAQARQELPEIERQLAELERREREELPGLEQRVTELSEMRRSFGTVEHMSNDLLTAVDTIKELEQELKKQDEVQEDLQSMEEQIAHARLRVQEAQQGFSELESRRDTLSQLEARIQRLQALLGRLADLSRAEDNYARAITDQGVAQENEARLRKVGRDLQETEDELRLVEGEARQIQKQTEELDKRWRNLGVRRQVEEWVRLRDLSEGLGQAELHVRQAHDQKELLNHHADEAKSASRKYMLIVGVCAIFFFICLVLTVIEWANAPIVATVAGIAAIILLGVGYISYQNLRKARIEEQAVTAQIQDAVNRLGMMVAARETAKRVGGGGEAIGQIEHEIRQLGGTVPRSLDEARAFLQQVQDQGESLADLQQQVQERREGLNAARSQVNVTMEAVALLRKERAHLEDIRKKEQWDTLEERLQRGENTVELLRQEITLLAGQEGLPSPSINARLRTGPLSNGPLTPLPEPIDDLEATLPDLETLVESTIKSTERELASLDGKLDMVSDLANQVKIHQDALDVLLVRQQVIEERDERYKTSNPALQVQRAREQQAALNQALQALKDSLRQRVKPLGITFGQASITNAEQATRKQLEELHITLGGKMLLQEKHTSHVEQLKDRQEALAEYYKQLAKFSNTLGSWIVPPNPFAEALLALRTRCQNEIQEAHEAEILKELDGLQNKQGAAMAKVELCRQEIETLQEKIAALLKERKRPTPRAYQRKDIVSVWPLVGEHTSGDRTGLEEERGTVEQELSSLEEQELSISQGLQIEHVKLDFEQTRLRLEQQEHSYETRKRGGQLIKAVQDRLMHKLIPRTEHYMQQLLPLLTSHRYHDVHLTTENEDEKMSSSGALRLRVWEAAAGEYVSKEALSTGTADQLSLALRLAFTIAALPRELNAAPGFVVLDEPLSSFDQGRAQALADVVTGEILGQHFEQIVLISHSHAFNPAMFPYHVYMDDGLVAESNLPVVASLPNTDPEALEDEEEQVEGMGETQARLPIVRAVGN